MSGTRCVSASTRTRRSSWLISARRGSGRTALSKPRSWGSPPSTTSVVQDQSDEGSAPDNLFTPALTRPLLKCCVNYSESGVQVSSPRFDSVGHIRDRTSCTQRARPPSRLSPRRCCPRHNAAIEPEALALGVFGGIVALACLLIAAQLIGRQIRLGADERQALRALGASPGQIWADGLIGLVGSVVSGGLLAVVVAVSLSPIAPIGPVRPVYPDLGLNFDWTVLGLGLLVLVLALSAISAAVSFRGMPHAQSADDVASQTAAFSPPVRGCCGEAACSRPHGCALRPCTRERPHGGPRTLGRAGSRDGGDSAGWHGDLRGQPQLARLPPVPLRLELGLHVGRRR